MTCPSEPAALIPARRRAGAANSPAIPGGLSPEAPPRIDGILTALRIYRMLQASPGADTIVQLCERMDYWRFS
jgi:hypothetical protein